MLVSQGTLYLPGAGEVTRSWIYRAALRLSHKLQRGQRVARAPRQHSGHLLLGLSYLHANPSSSTPRQESFTTVIAKNLLRWDDRVRDDEREMTSIGQTQIYVHRIQMFVLFSVVLFDV